jgi:16S rRNA (guanine527-N7)-methyltransferase
MSQSALAAGLATLGLDLPAAAQQKLLAFRDLLLKWNKTYNLTALRDPQQAISHHLLDSLAILPHVGDGNLLDVGSGGGLPGIPLAIARPELAVTMVDTVQKKATFLQQAAIELGLKNVAVHHAGSRK